MSQARRQVRVAQSAMLDTSVEKRAVQLEPDAYNRVDGVHNVDNCNLGDHANGHVDFCSYFDHDFLVLVLPFCLLPSASEALLPLVFFNASIASRNVLFS